jgi:hypothetical protein
VLYQVIVQAAEPVLVETLQVPYLPATLWAVVTGMSLVLVFLALGLYLWYSALANQAAHGRPVHNSSKAARGNCTHAACAAACTT